MLPKSLISCKDNESPPRSEHCSNADVPPIVSRKRISPASTSLIANITADPLSVPGTGHAQNHTHTHDHTHDHANSIPLGPTASMAQMRR